MNHGNFVDFSGQFTLDFLPIATPRASTFRLFCTPRNLQKWTVCNRSSGKVQNSKVFFFQISDDGFFFLERQSAKIIPWFMTTFLETLDSFFFCFQISINSCSNRNLSFCSWYTIVDNKELQLETAKKILFDINFSFRNITLSAKQKCIATGCLLRLDLQVL